MGLFNSSPRIQAIKRKVAKVHSTAQREALSQIVSVLEEQEQEIQDLEKQIKYHGKIIRGE